MYSLYHALLAQHPRQLTALRCAPSTIAQLHGYFEEVVLENNLGALVIESLPTDEVRERFVVIADARFSALLASTTNSDDTSDGAGDMVVWTFEPDIVYSAL